MSRIKAYQGNEPYIFISYAHADAEVQDLLYDLADKNYRFWYDEGIKSGRDWADEITERIKNCTQFIAILSDNAIQSENVKDEIHLAVKYKIDMLIIHLESIELDGGLELHLDRKQALLKYAFASQAEFSSKLFQAINNKTVRIVDNSPNSALAEFKSNYDILRLWAVDSCSKTYIVTKKASYIYCIAKHYFPDNWGRDYKHRAETECYVLRQLQSCPFAPFLIDHFEDEHNVVMVETYMEGEYLSQLKKALDRQDVDALQMFCVGVTLSVAESLSYLHSAKEPIVHRDIQPRNILVNSRGYAIISDFYSCKMPFSSDNTIYGTRGYASPEHYRGEMDERSDIFSLGITMLELLTNCNPSDASNFYYGKPLRAYDERFSPELERIIWKMTNLEPKDRYQSIEDVIADLKIYKEKDQTQRRQLLRDSQRRIKEFLQYWANFEKELLHKTSAILPIGDSCIKTFCNGSSNAELTLDHEQFLINEELRNRDIPEDERLNYEDEAWVCFAAPSPIRNCDPIVVDFEVIDANNIKTLTVSVGGESKEVTLIGKKFSVRFDLIPTLLDLARNEEKIQIQRVGFGCYPEDLVDQKKPAKLTIANVTMRKA